METQATSKGQVVIPAEVRRKLGIKRGTRMHVEVDAQSRIILTPITREYIGQLCGSLKDSGALRVLETERRKDRAREEAKFNALKSNRSR